MHENSVCLFICLSLPKKSTSVSKDFDEGKDQGSINNNGKTIHGLYMKEEVGRLKMTHYTCTVIIEAIRMLLGW